MTVTSSQHPAPLSSSAPTATAGESEYRQAPLYSIALRHGLRVIERGGRAVIWLEGVEDGTVEDVLRELNAGGER